MRIALQAVMIVGVLLAVHSFIGSNTLLDLAVITYMSAPATFSMQTFLKREDGSAYVSTTNSLYCIVSIVVYMILAFLHIKIENTYKQVPYGARKPYGTCYIYCI